MKNREYWKEKIADIALGGDSIAIVNDEPIACDIEICSKCEIRASAFMDCDIERLERWSDEEYIPKPILTGDEAELIRLVIKHSAFNAKTIMRASNDDGEYNRLLFQDEQEIEILDVKKEAFIEMELYKSYKVKELIGVDDDGD